MHQSLHGEIMRNRVADLHRQAERDQIARAASRARRSRRQHAAGPGPDRNALAQRLLPALRAWRITRRPAN